MVENNVPVGVKVISIIGIILGAIGLVLAPVFLLAAAFGHSSSSGGMSSAESIFALIIFILPAIFIIFLSVMLLKRKNWARWIITILFLIAAVLTLADQSKLFQQWMDLGAVYYINIPMTIFGLIISGYLIFSKKVKEAFN